MPEERYKELKMDEYDNKTAALMLVQQARLEIDHGRLATCDSMLRNAQTFLLQAGSKDIGPLADPGDYSDEIYNEKYQSQKKVERLEDKVDELEQRNNILERVFEGIHKLLNNPMDESNIEKIQKEMEEITE